LKLSTIKHRTNKAIKKKLDVLWSQIIRKRNNGLCEVCGKPAQNSHHIISRKYLALRWDLHNGINLCISCHVFGKNSAHQNPLFFMEYFKSIREEDYAYLKERQNIVAGYKMADFELILENLKAEYGKF
jgi:hypothetical protein